MTAVDEEEQVEVRELELVTGGRRVADTHTDNPRRILRLSPLSG